MLQPEPGAQQCAGVVGHALQLRLIGDAAFALLGGFLALLRPGLCLLLPLLLAQGLLHALALRGIGLLLALRIRRLRGLRLATLRLVVLRRCVLRLLSLPLSLSLIALLRRRLTLCRLVLLRLALLPVLLRLPARRLALAHCIHLRAVVDGIAHPWLQLQRTVVGGDGLVVAPHAGQRIAEVVLAVCGLVAAEFLDGLVVLLLAIGGHAVLHSRIGLLVGATPHAARVLRLRLRLRLRLCLRHRQQQGHCQHRRQRTATTEQRQRQQHDQRQQPITIVAPGRCGFTACRRATIDARIQHAERAQIAIACGQRPINTATARCQCLQARRIQPRTAQAAADIEHAALRGTKPERGHAIAGHARTRGLGERVTIGTIGQQQDVAALEAGILQQALRPGDGTLDAMPILRHDIRRQRIEEQGDVGGIRGQRRDGVGIVGERDQRDFATRAFLQQAGELRTRLRQPRGWQIARQHRAGQVDRDHQRRFRLPQRPFGLAKTRARHRQQRECQSEQTEPARPRPALRTGCIVEQMRQQMRIHSVLPHAVPTRSHAPPPCKHGQREQAQQPPRAQEMQLRKIGQRGTHARLRSSTASRPSSNAQASGRG